MENPDPRPRDAASSAVGIPTAEPTLATPAAVAPAFPIALEPAGPATIRSAPPPPGLLDRGKVLLARGRAWWARLRTRPEPDATPAGLRLRRRRRSARSLRREAPAWVVSVLVHGIILTGLGLATLTPEVRKAVAELNSAMIDTSLSEQQAAEFTHIWSDPSESPRELATAELVNTPGLGEGLTATGPPSDTPRVAMATSVTERGSMPSPNVISPLMGLTVKPPSAVLRREIGGGLGGQIAGDVARPVDDVGEALDQLAREILRHLEEHKLTIVWMFDESNSMKDEQQAIKAKFNRVANELKLHHDPAKAATSDALTHVIVGFGEGIHVEQKQPTADLGVIGRAIDRLRVDESGIENLCNAVTAAINLYARLIDDQRRLLLVIVTDESSDDGQYIERTRLAAVRNSVPIYVIGRQAMFGSPIVRLPYQDPVTKDIYWPSIRRGPETAGLENLQYDGLHDRWDEQPSGFGPYELARLTKDTGGIYFLLPNEEELRRKDKRLEKAYSMATLKEYVPDYESRTAYQERVAKSPLRGGLVRIIEQTAKYGYRIHFSTEPSEMLEQIDAELPKVTEQLNVLIALEQQLRALERERDREPERRWQAAYDLMLAQVVTYQIKAYEYRALLQDMARRAVAGQLRPSKVSVPGQLVVEWEVRHAPDSMAPKEDTEAKRATAKALLETVIERHPDSPWADLAQLELDRGFGCKLGEWHHDPRYEERRKFVPNF